MKYQVITLAAKVYAQYFPTSPVDADTLDPHLKQMHLLYTYAMSLARYDTSYDLRDRARLLKNVHGSPLHQAVLHTPKPVPRLETLGEHGVEWMLGSMAQVIGRDTEGQITLPEWGSEIPEKGVRDPPEPSQTATAVVSAPLAASPSRKEEKKREKKVWKDLEKFYASESESDNDEKEEEESEEEEDEEEEEEESEESGEDEDEEDEDSEESNHQQQLKNAWRR